MIIIHVKLLQFGFINLTAGFSSKAQVSNGFLSTGAQWDQLWLCTGCDVHKMWQSTWNLSLAQQLFHLLTYLTEALQMTATDSLNRKSCVKLSTIMPPRLQFPKDLTRPSALHCTVSTSDTCSYFQRLREREKNPGRKLPAPAKKNLFP